MRLSHAGSVFAGLDPKTKHETIAELRNARRENLTRLVKELDGSCIGDPLEITAMQNTLGESLLGLGEPNPAVEVFTKALEARKAGTRETAGCAKARRVDRFKRGRGIPGCQAV
jgi:hypothetical protein